MALSGRLVVTARVAAWKLQEQRVGHHLDHMILWLNRAASWKLGDNHSSWDDLPGLFQLLITPYRRNKRNRVFGIACIY